MDQIYKLQPHRTMHLQGFDAYGAAAALWGASDTGFSVSGVFRDQGDFAVLVLFQKDDPFGHPRFSYLPDGNFTGLKLDFDIQWQGIEAFESKKSPWTDWAYLDCLLGNGQRVQKLLFQIATGPGGRTGASGTFTLNSGTVAAGDRVTLWYQNRAFDYTVPAFTPSCVQAMWWQGNATYTHSVTIGSHTYGVQEGSLNSAQIATAVANLVNASDPNCSATAGGTYNNEITLALQAGVAGPVAVSSSDGSGPATLTNVTPAMVCQNIAAQINATDWVANGPVALSAAATGNQITITAEPGADGNMMTFYELHKNANLYFTPATVQLAGGSSDSVTWHITADFSALGWTDIQELWLTFAPALANGAAYQSTEWSVTVTNWSVTDTGGVRPLKVAGPGSVRIEEDNPWVVRSGYWEPAPADGFAFWSQGRAIRSSASGDSVTIETHCQATHDIYLGTRLDSNCGIVQASLDGGTPVTLDCYASPASQVRRKLFASVAPGQHSVVITITGTKNAASSGWYFYFDFLECVVPSDIPDAPETRTDVGVATDYDTDATYKFSPQRLIWNIQKIGLVGEIDHYCGVFWWKQSTAVGGNYPSVTVTFGGTWADQDVVWLNFGGTLSGGVITGGTSIGKTAFPTDTASTIASHFAYFINEKLVGVWASASGPVLTITTRSTGAIWMYSFITQTNSVLGTITVPGATATTSGGQKFTNSTALETGAADPTWTIDPTAGQVFNRAFRDWHADYFAALHSAGLGVTISFSQELVNPPDNPGGGVVWVQRYPDNTPVQTATGFGTLYSSQAAFGSPVESYMKSAHKAMAGLLNTASMPIRLQFGEALWWFQANASGMAFYDADTQAAAQTALGHALATFHTPNDDPSVNSYADANFLRARLKTYVDAIRTYVLVSYPAAQFELLWPKDVNDPDTCRLTRYINLPTEWETRSGSGFDTFMSEGFQYDGVDHDIDKAVRCAAYPFAELSWDKPHCRYLMGWYYSGWPWQREYLAARRTGVPMIKFWAYDHLSLYGWPLPLPIEKSFPSFI
jgi:hypothetical protein